MTARTLSAGIVCAVLIAACTTGEVIEIPPGNALADDGRFVIGPVGYADGTGVEQVGTAGVEPDRTGAMTQVNTGRIDLGDAGELADPDDRCDTADEMAGEFCVQFFAELRRTSGAVQPGPGMRVMGQSLRSVVGLDGRSGSSLDPSAADIERRILTGDVQDSLVAQALGSDFLAPAMPPVPVDPFAELLRQLPEEVVADALGVTGQPGQ